MHDNERSFAESLAPLSARHRAFRLLVITQVIFFASLAWCVLLVHTSDATNSGISYYGAHGETLIYAIIGFLAAAIGLWCASTLFKEGGLDPLVWVGLRVVAVSLVLLLATPYTGGTFLNWAHMVTGVVGALVQLAISFTLVRRSPTAGTVAGASVQLLGGILGAFSLPDWSFEILLYAEIIIEIGFSWCLLEWTKHLASVEVGDSAASRFRPS